MKRASLALVLVLATACASSSRPSPETGIAPPETWTGADVPAGAPAGSWWASLDPSLASLVDEALENNRDLQAAAARLDAAAAEARIAGADLYPQLAAGLNGRRRKQNFIGFPEFPSAPPGAGGTDADEVLSTESTNLGVSLDLSWEADLWGRIRAGKASAVAELQASAADLAGARQSLAAQTVKAWLAAVEVGEQLVLAERTAESYRASAEQIRSRYMGGVAPPLDLRLALNSLATAEATVRQRREQHDRARRQLEILLGRYPSASLDTGASLPATPPAVPAGLPADLVGRRPDLVASERRLTAAGSRVLVSRRALYPRLTLTASGGTSTEALRDLLNGDFSVWSLAAGLLQPVFQGGRLRAGVSRSEALERQALAAYASTALRAYAEVESALAAEAHLAAREGHLAEAAHEARAALRLADRRYGSGLEPYVTVLEAQRRELVAEIALLSVRRLRLDNRVDLHLALGGGFTEDTAKDQVAALTPEVR